MSDLTLYNLAYSTCSQKVRLCLNEKRLTFADTRLNFRKFDQLQPWYLDLNPNGVVPTLVHDGIPIVDSSVIMEYLDEAFPETILSPKNSVVRAGMRAWLRFFEEVPTNAIRYPSFSKVFVRHYQDFSDEEMAETAARRPLRKQFYLKMGQNGFDEEALNESSEALRKTILRMENTLLVSPWLCGDELTLADYCVVPTIDRMNDLGMSNFWEDTVGFKDWWERIRARPAYEMTYFNGSRISDLYEDFAASYSKKADEFSDTNNSEI